MYSTYVLLSFKNNSYYIGQTNNIETRLQYHNKGENKSTKPNRPWKLIYKKEFQTRAEATKYERYLKSLKSRRALEKIINRDSSRGSSVVEQRTHKP